MLALNNKFIHIILVSIYKGLIMSINRSKIITSIIALPIACLSLFAHADDKGFYLGAGINVSSLEPIVNTDYSLDDDSDRGYQFLGGYDFNSKFFFEYEYADLGAASLASQSVTVASGTIDYKVHSLGLGWKPFDIINDGDTRFAPYIKVGACSLKNASDTITYNTNGGNNLCNAFWGVGAQLTKGRYSYRLGYDKYLEDVSAVKLSAILHFGKPQATRKPKRVVAPAPAPRPVAPRPAPRPVAPAPVVNNDNDNDGVNNASDLCPNSSVNASVESDGCIALPIVHFDNDSIIIATEELQHVETVVTLMKRNPSLKVSLKGYASKTTGTPSEYNKKLSKNRASNVKQALILAGISANRLSDEYFGDVGQVCSNDSERNQRCNRRVEFYKTR